jgi:hypothetical protein
LLYNCCTNGANNAPKHLGTPRNVPYYTTTYARPGRLVNGDAVIVQASNRQEALEFAGLALDPAKEAAAMGEPDVAGYHLHLIHEGVGPQNYTIREIEHFLCVAHLDDEGDFEMLVESAEGSDEFYVDYPHLREAEQEHLRSQFDDPTFENPEVRRLYREAVEKERTRLLITG